MTLAFWLAEMDRIVDAGGYGSDEYYAALRNASDEVAWSDERAVERHGEERSDKR